MVSVGDATTTTTVNNPADKVSLPTATIGRPPVRPCVPSLPRAALGCVVDGAGPWRAMAGAHSEQCSPTAPGVTRDPNPHCLAGTLGRALGKARNAE